MMSGEAGGSIANSSALEALRRLLAALTELDETGAKAKGGSHERSNSRGLPLSHWRELPADVSAAFKMLDDGSELVRATSTKYTLVGKVDSAEGSKLAEDLRKGCELLSTGALVLHSRPAGCGRSARRFARQSSRSVVAAVISLIQSFLDGSAMENNVGAQKTGAVWSACDGVKKVPKGNRNAARRELLTWCGECNETMSEFEEIMALGPAPNILSAINEDGSALKKQESSGSAGWDDFCEGMDQYSIKEMPVAQACLGLVKCSRGTIGAALKACECAGEVASGQAGDTENRKKAVLQWISDLLELTRAVGEGMTDLGVLLYPPLKGLDLGKHINSQHDAILAVHGFILDGKPATEEGEQDVIAMSEEVTGLANKLRAAAGTRAEEARAAVTAMMHR